MSKVYRMLSRAVALIVEQAVRLFEQVVAEQVDMWFAERVGALEV
jgi:hypothetical protein